MSTLTFMQLAVDIQMHVRSITSLVASEQCHQLIMIMVCIHMKVLMVIYDDDDDDDDDNDSDYDDDDDSDYDDDDDHNYVDDIDENDKLNVITYNIYNYV